MKHYPHPDVVDRKNGIEDIKKARWYINKFIELQEENDGKE